VPADTQPPSRPQRGLAFESEGVRVETVDWSRLAKDAEKAAAAPPSPSPPRPARKEEHTPLRRYSNSPRSPRPADEGEAAENRASPPATEALIESALPLPAHQPSPRRSKVTARPGGRPALRQSTDEDTLSRRGPKHAGAFNSPRCHSRSEEEDNTTREATAAQILLEELA
jgi:hypothetical protein